MHMVISAAISRQRRHNDTMVQGEISQLSGLKELWRGRGHDGSGKSGVSMDRFSCGFVSENALSNEENAIAVSSREMS